MKTCPSAKLAAPPLPPLFDKPGAAPVQMQNHNITKYFII